MRLGRENVGGNNKETSFRHFFNSRISPESALCDRLRILMTRESQKLEGISSRRWFMENRLVVAFSDGVCTGNGLISLSLHTNLFNGSLPDAIGRCWSLERFQVQNNEFRGNFLPWALLEHVQIDNNSLTDKISRGSRPGQEPLLILCLHEPSSWRNPPQLLRFPSHEDP
ncbi:hypothetical protein CRG98_005616 [Punica granatum]|uniref:Uncharacterized protein n=1 Tax=Punica granatum TaxID=22663 RepID=A0A2I0KZX0_PUNGR|nr:hypothetical protein CRG98_005616 [Punica granatum]